MIQQPSLDAPVPGEGLTHELGDRPWQKPAQYTTVDEVDILIHNGTAFTGYQNVSSDAR